MARPALVGSITVLVTLVAVYLAYNANNGLPFVPTTTVKLQAAGGANLVPGNDVREGGFRIGVLRAMEPVKLPSGVVGAELTVALDAAAGDVPVDSRWTVRPKSAIGGKYIELARGRSRSTLSDNDVVPVRQTGESVALDEFLSTFDARTRKGVEGSITGLGEGLAFRGPSLNSAIAALPRLLGATAPVMANLSAAETRLRRFVTAAASAAAEVAPVARRQGPLFADMAGTFAALTRDPQALRATFAELPATLGDGQRSLRASRPFLTQTAATARRLDTMSRSLVAALPGVTAAVTELTPPVRRTATFARRLEGTLAALGRLTSAGTTPAALRALTAGVATLQPQVRYYGPHFTVCNVPTYWATLVAEVISAPDPTGTVQRGLPQAAGPGDDNLITMGANEPATGRGVPQGMTPQYNRSGTGASAVHEDGSADCMVGQSGAPWGNNPADPTDDRFYARATLKATDGQGEGPSFRRLNKQGRGEGLNPARVPDGLTFTARPGGRAAPEYHP